MTIEPWLYYLLLLLASLGAGFMAAILSSGLVDRFSRWWRAPQ